jgi:YbbR domain-containing protein
MAYREIFTRDLGWKIFSVSLAVVLWLTVHAISEDRSRRSGGTTGLVTQTYENVPVLVVSAAADVREFKVQPEVVSVTVTARQEIMSGIAQRDIEARVDLTDMKDFATARSLRKRVIISLPAGVTLNRAVPSDVDVLVPAKKSE